MSNSLTLSSLLSPWGDFSSPELDAIAVEQLELDSRAIKDGDIFVAVVGHAVDGRRFIDKAVSQGANAVIAQADAEKAHGLIEWLDAVPVVYIKDLNLVLSELAGRVYSFQTTKLIGVTGTNGKTTITQLIAQWLDLVGQRSAVMGTTGNGFLDNLKTAANTTGSAIEIQRTLSELAEENAVYTAMEISSHGLVQGRVKALDFEAGVFTNLSRDHLDYHGTMEEYALAKKSLFTQHKCKHAVINVDDEIGKAWMSDLSNAIAVSLLPLTGYQQSVWASDVAYAETGIKLSFDGSWGQGDLSVPLIGQFNASNVLVAFATLLSLGIDKQILVDTAPQLQPVIGRMELFQVPNKAKVVVDYAHTPDALEKALAALRVHCSGKLWAIFGCGGDRDTGKRPMMAVTAEQFADNIIISDDNPRSEDPALIVKDMLAGLSEPEVAFVEHDRFQAVKFALEQAGNNDIILLAGKGHEDYQVLKDKTIHYSDRESALQLLGIS
ncbi:UDP-N-acetylmuramoyl-L-alanyl-D-glutamate--2,6-diaminopimelate ligase [Vibrio crassostreae]|uniref:UDP-N-acetylmuramoyl-L-alanyl-D-glutamate--2, 6-diaminopimelate ligase n=1 Tax=Vibrio crassostreae TaxID=246167 RepID=UPI0002FB75A2|nr:UDP-N-acetylmuramoyl-L-alanyl-D-glutamate--2,6-diaminopimelate ligase [Vibrio crassostreae]OEE90884.1 UDP-N-acetylmuramoyl-L-alanyl-D-glutamate--2,6-diaminopimelate ligase [Vibrio crassostreae 9ZC77]